MYKGRIFILLALLGGIFGGGRAFSQNDFPYTVQDYPFVRQDLNHLIFPGDSSDFQALYQRIDQVLFRGEGQINIVHIGGSHIQADMWSDRLRQRLQTFYPGTRGSRGLLFPFRMAKTNNPYNYRPEYTGTWERCRCTERKKNCTLGLTGISVTTYDTLSSIRIFFRGDDYPQYAFNRIRVFHDLGPTAFSLALNNDSTIYRIEEEPENGCSVIYLDAHLTEMELVIRKADSLQNHFTLYGIGLESDDPGFVYHAIGVNGAATTSYKRCNLFETHLRPIQPDLVVFSIGINDANGPKFDPSYYERNYDELVRRVKAANPQAAILFTTNNDSYYQRRYPNRNAEKVRDAMLNLAKRHGAAVWDMYGVMGGLGSIKKWQAEGLANKDKIHLLKPGYQLVADLMFNALLESYDRHLSASAPPSNK